MEFTVERTLGRRGWRSFIAGTIVTAVALGWLVAGTMRGRTTATGDLNSDLAMLSLVLFLSVVAALRGLYDLRKRRRPFRLRIDAFGITLHDAELAWEQIEAVSLWHRANSGEDGTPHQPRLTLWTAADVKLARRTDHTFDGRTRYTLVDCKDLDQSVTELTSALAEHAGDRFETAPRAMRPPIPVTVSGPERNVPGGEQVFVDRRQAGTWTLVWATAAVILSYSFWELVHSHAAGPVSLTVTCLVGAVVCWPLAGRSLVRWRTPLRLRIGPSGIGMREVSEEERYFTWAQIAAVTVGRRFPHVEEPQPWLVVWPLPGTNPSVPGVEPVLPGPYHVDGHKAYALVRLDRLPGGPEAIVPVIRAYAGERYAETA
ncbi:hypothetical protein ACFYXS_26935 [Streptomyces sp. NPDC002574]|uniref:hypothetical protein n=1 Tax=Streptomyces sp. NPDC002574 TaxID=3364652 RepID=UPI0036A3EAEF